MLICNLSYSQDFEIKTNSGHSNIVEKLALSKDGSLLVSVSWDKTVKVWDTRTARELRTIYPAGYLNVPNAVAVSPDNKLIITGSKYGSFQVYDLLSGKAITEIKTGSLESIHNIEFSPDGKKIIISAGSSLSDDKAYLAEWDVGTWKEIRKYEGVKGSVNYCSYSPDGKMLVANSGYMIFGIEIILWSTETGAVIKKFTGHRSDIYCADFSHDGKYIASAGKDHQLILWNIETGKYLWLSKPDNRLLRSLVFTPDDKYILAGGDGGKINIIDINTGKLVRQIKGHDDAINDIKISGDGKRIYTASYDSTIKIWDFNTGIEVKTIAGSNDGIDWLFNIESTGETYILYYNEIKIWDLSKLEIKKRIIPDKDFPTLVSHSRDGKLLAFSNSKYQVKFVNNETDKVVNILDIGRSFFFADISPDRSMFSATGADSNIYVRDIITGAVKMKFHTDDKFTCAYFADNKTLVFERKANNSINLLEIETGKITYTDNSVTPQLTYRILANSNKIVGVSTGASKYEWSLLTKERKSEWFFSLDRDIKSSEISYDGKKFISLTDKKIKVLDIATNNVLMEVSGNFSYMNWVMPLSDPDKFAVGSHSGEFAVYDIKTKKKILSLYTRDPEWIAIAPDGYFSGSAECNEMVSMVKGNTITSVDQYALKLNRPDILLKRMGNKDIELQNHYYNQYKKRLKKAGIDETMINTGAQLPVAEIKSIIEGDKNIKMKLSFSVNSGELKSYNIYVNNVPLYGKGKEVSGKMAELDETFELCSGENKIEVSCMNNSGAESYRPLWFSFIPEEVKGDLYFIAFGVSKYMNQNFNLHYADKDAMDLEALLKNENISNYKNIHTKVYINEAVTVSAVKDAKSFLKDAKPDDTFILFIAGHGIHDNDADATYYFLTHEAVLDSLALTAADFDMIEDLLQNIQPRKKMLFMDTCESGEKDDNTDNSVQKSDLGYNVETRGLKLTENAEVNNRKKRSVKNSLTDRNNYIYTDLSRRSGAVVISSSKGGENSYETDKYQNGVFTEMIIAGLSGNADRNNNGKITKKELFDYVLEEVSKSTGNAQHPTIDRDNVFQKIELPVIK
jgi:WD40 repeat protein